MTTDHELTKSDRPLQNVNKSVQYRAPLLILSLFFLSVLLRSHAINDSIRGGHVWLTAHTVLTLQIWFDEGISTHHFSPIYTFDNDADRNMRSLASGIPDEEGNYYYVSYAPFSFLFAFFILKILGVYPSMLALQVINLMIHLITSWLIYLVICRFYRKDVRGPVWPPAVVASVIYLFSMHPMWCHVYMYFADTLVQMLWVLGIYWALGLFMYRKIEHWSSVVLFGMLIFITIYTEWIGLFFSATVFCLAGLHAIKDKIYFRLMFVVAFFTCLAMSVFVLQYGSIYDVSTFVEASFNKYFERSGYNEHGAYFTKLNAQFIVRHYKRLYYPLIGMILFLFVTTLVNKKQRTSLRRKKEFAILSGLVLLPIIAHHVVFMGFTKVHDFALLKSSVFAAIVIGILYNRSSFHPIPAQKKLFQMFSIGIIGIMMILSLISYYDFVDFDDGSIFEEVGNVVQKTSSDDEALYLVSESDRENGIMIYMAEHRSISPQVQMIAGRNLLGVQNKIEAIDHMKKFGYSKGRVYTLNTKGHVINIEALSLP